MYVLALRVLIVIWLLHETISANRVLHQLGKTREMNIGKSTCIGYRDEYVEYDFCYYIFVQIEIDKKQP